MIAAGPYSKQVTRVKTSWNYEDIRFCVYETLYSYQESSSDALKWRCIVRSLEKPLSSCDKELWKIATEPSTNENAGYGPR